jgi:hypothetical protein
MLGALGCSFSQSLFQFLPVSEHCRLAVPVFHIGLGAAEVPCTPASASVYRTWQSKVAPIILLSQKYRTII